MKFKSMFLIILIWFTENVISKYSVNEPLRVLFCTNFGSASHTKPMLEYAVKVRERGHQVTFIALKEFQKMVQLYNFTFVAHPDELTLANQASNMLANDTVYGSYELLSRMISTVNHYYIRIYHELRQWMTNRKNENNLPHVMVADNFASACFELANEFDIPVINSATRVIPFMAGFPSNINSGFYFETVWLSKLPIWKRLQRKVFDVVRMIPVIIAIQKKIELLQAEAKVPTQNPFGRMSTKVLLANTFFPFTPGALYPSNIRMVGPVMASIYDELNEELKDELDRIHSEGKRGVLVAFGSVAILTESILSRLYEGIVKALDAGIIHRVFWSVGGSHTHLFSKLNDTRISFISWLPQYALLQHPGIQLFVTHGGAESIHESVYSGTPMLAIPIFAEQPGNSFRMQEMGLGKAFHKYFFSPKEIADCIRTILLDESETYKVRVNSLKEIAHKSSKRGLELAADTIEVIGMHGDDHFLLHQHRGENWIKENNIDIWMIFLGVFLSVIWNVVKLIK